MKHRPTIEDRVVIGAGAVILGLITVGKGGKIGTGSLVVRPFPAGATVVGVLGRIADPNAPPQNGPQPCQSARSHVGLGQQATRLTNRLGRGCIMQEALPGPEAEKLMAQMEREDEIREALRDVLDPEVGIDIVNQSPIKEIIILDDDKVKVNMVLTSRASPMASKLTEQVRRRVEGLHDIEHVEVKVLDEP